MKITRRYTDADLERWRRMRDVVSGEEAVKAADLAHVRSRNHPVAGNRMAGHKYLPRPNPMDLSKENDARYLHYVQRAHFFGVTGRTVSGLVGMATKTPASAEIPDRMDAMRANVDGAGLDMDGLASSAVREVMVTGRAGLFVDFVDGTPTRADVPTISLVPAEDIIAWHSEWSNNRSVLRHVVIREHVETQEEFSIEREERFLALWIEDGRYVMARFVQAGEGEFDEVPDSRREPRDQAGRPMTEIPFVFLGAVCNNDAIDLPPILDLADTNLAHYRNSADFEESVFLLGQPWPVFENLSIRTIERFEKDGIVFGSRGPALLGEGESAHLLQVEPNTLAQEAMKQKEAQMVKLGAQLMEPSVVMTAEQSRNEANATYSQLSLAVRNVSRGITRALAFAAEFVRQGASVSYSLKTDFTSMNLDSNALREIVAGWQEGAYPRPVMYDGLRRIGFTEKTDEELDELIAQEDF